MWDGVLHWVSIRFWEAIESSRHKEISIKTVTRSVKMMVFRVVTIKLWKLDSEKAKNAFKLWIWRQFLGMLWNARKMIISSGWNKKWLLPWGNDQQAETHIFTAREWYKLWCLEKPMLGKFRQNRRQQIRYMEGIKIISIVL